MDHIYRHDLSVLRDSLRRLGAIVAEVDRNLRYIWIDNLHPDFDARSVIGCRDDELIPAAEAEPIMRFKREAWRIQAPVGLTLQFRRSDGARA